MRRPAPINTATKELPGSGMAVQTRLVLLMLKDPMLLTSLLVCTLWKLPLLRIFEKIEASDHVCALECVFQNAFAMLTLGPKITLNTVAVVLTSTLPLAETVSKPEAVELAFKSHSKIDPLA